MPGILERSECIRRLAVRIRDANRAELAEKSLDAKLRYPYYLLNIDQRALHGMYIAMKAAAAIRATDPPGDLDRLAWELGLLSDEALAEIERYYPDVTGDKGEKAP